MILVDPLTTFCVSIHSYDRPFYILRSARHTRTHTHVLMYDPCKNRIPIYEKRCYNYVHSHRCALILYKMTNLFCTQTHVNSLPQFVFALGVCTCISTGSSSHRRRISSLRTDAYNLSVEHLVNLFHIKWMFLLSFLFKSMSFAPFAHCLPTVSPP